MELLTLVQSDVCYRYRVAAYGPALRRLGWNIKPRLVPANPRQWLALKRDVRRADAVLLQRRLLGAWQRWLLRRWARTLIYDIDDAVFGRDSNSRKLHFSGGRLKRFRALVHCADAVLAGNAYLATEAARWTAAPVHQVPTCVDVARYPAAQHVRRGGDVRLVWIGSRSTMASLDQAHACLVEASLRTPGLQLWIICDTFPQLRGVDILPRRWSTETEARDLANADIGVSWLPHHHWSLGKCGLKVLQYMAAGLPVVANPVGVHRELIQHGKTGFLVRSPREWADCIGWLAADPQRRGEMGHEARQFVQRHYDVACGASALASVLWSLTPGASWASRESPDASEVTGDLPDVIPMVRPSSEATGLSEGRPRAVA